MEQFQIAITGNIGSGKSTFSGYLASKGFAVISADDISKTILKTDNTVKQKVISKFGNEAYKNDQPNISFLADKVFNNPVNLNILNSILHPIVISEIESIIHIKYPDNKLIFIESAIVYETGIEEIFDYVVLVTSEFQSRLQRAVQDKNISEDDFRKRDQHQIPEKEKQKKAHFIFSNNGSKEDLFKKADLLLLTLGTEKK